MLRVQLDLAISKFLIWLDKNGYVSYDVYDFWSSYFGIFAKRLFNKNKYLSYPIVGIIQLSDSFFPHSRVLFAKKKRFAIGDAQLASGFLNYYKYTKDEEHLVKASDLISDLLNNSTVTKNGMGWGYPYRWVTSLFEYKENTPLITVTPYCFEAILKAYEITGKKEYLNDLRKIANFVAYEMKETEFNNETSGASYGPDDDSLVFNAIAYRSSLLAKAGILFKDNVLLIKARKNISYVLSKQNSDGSWFYSDSSRFIDNFHTCFILNNLVKCYEIFKENYMLDSLKKGYEFYSNNFCRDNGTLKHFYKIKYQKFRKIEFYDYAEAIKLGVNLKDLIPEAYDLATELCIQLITNYQSSKGYFYTRINSLGGVNKIPYLRWPQAQLFNALSALLLCLDNKEGNQN